MSQANIKKVSIPATTTFHSRKVATVDSNATVNTDTFMIPVRDQNSGDSLDFAIYEWDLTSDFESGLSLSALDVIQVELEFYVRKASEVDPIGSIDIVGLTSQPSGQGTNEKWTSANTSTDYYVGAHAIQDNNKTLKKFILSSSEDSLASTRMETAIKNNTFFAVAVRRNSAETGNGYIELSGLTMLKGEGEDWEDAGSDVSAAPILTVTYSIASTSPTLHEMRYTTTDPTSNQDTPSNSLGGYAANNVTFQRDVISENISSDETIIKVGGNPGLSSGLVQIGPEIMKYGSFNQRTLREITRGVVPASFPSSIDPYPENLHYLDPNGLFDRRPSSGLVQYRCVAIKQTSNTTASLVRVTLIQDEFSDVQIDIGIEVPEFDKHEGTLDDTASSGQKMFTSATTGERGVAGFASGFFEGGHVIIDPSGEAFEAIITSYDDTGGQAEFIVDTSLSTSFSAGTTFRINPAPSQVISNETVAPVENSSRFFGFLGSGAAYELKNNSIREFNGTMIQHDVFYLWIKRTLLSNVAGKENTGAIVLVYFE